MTDQHGTYAAYQRHIRAGDAPCADCRRAAAEYQATLRRRNPGLRHRERDRENAKKRAYVRLAQAYPAAFRALYAEERAR